MSNQPLPAFSQTRAGVSPTSPYSGPAVESLASENAADRSHATAAGENIEERSMT